jgi:2-alkyl-3-oxoalkanoate reductase
MKQRVLVLGASGFIGKQVVGALAAGDWATPVSARKRAVPPVSEGQPPSFQLDATDATQLRRALEGVTGVVNCVAGDSDTIVNSARALFSVAADLPQRPRIVHLSSIAVYGDKVGDVDEASLPSAGLSAYGAAKLEAERLAHDSPSAVALRLGIVYGPDSAQWSGRISQLLHAHRLGDLGSAGDGYCNLIYIADAVDAIIRALRTPDVAGKTFNLGLPDCPTWNEYFGRFAAALGAVPVARISKRRLRIESKIIAPPLKIAEIIVGKFAPSLARQLPQAIPPSLVRLFGQEIRMKVDCAEQALGIRWTPLEEGLLRTANWYQARSAAQAR